jgi:hypothetical protein
MKTTPDLIVRDEETPRFGVEHRYAWALAGGMSDAGLTIA